MNTTSTRTPADVAHDQLVDQAVAQCQEVARAMAACDQSTWDRIEEIDAIFASRWVIGSNVPGYLPDTTDNEGEFPGYADAVHHLDTLVDGMMPGGLTCKRLLSVLTQILESLIADQGSDVTALIDAYSPHALHLQASGDSTIRTSAFSRALCAMLLTRTPSPVNVSAFGRVFWIADTFETGTPDGDDVAELQAELNSLRETVGEYEDADDAESRLYEIALSVEVRSGWHAVGADSEPEEFRIVLCTGGPHVELRGELDRGEPSRVWVAARDWGQRIDDVGECISFRDPLLGFAQRLISV